LLLSCSEQQFSVSVSRLTAYSAGSGGLAKY